MFILHSIMSFYVNLIDKISLKSQLEKSMTIFQEEKI